MWKHGEHVEGVAKRCQLGDVVAIEGASVTQSPMAWSTSRLHYHLRLKNTRGMVLKIIKLKDEEWPWKDIPEWHPLVPLHAISRVKDKQQICVAARVEDNPGKQERYTQNGRQFVCNVVVQEQGIKMRCAFWRDKAEEIKKYPAGSCVMLQQVQVDKKAAAPGRLSASPRLKLQNARLLCSKNSNSREWLGLLQAFKGCLRGS